MYRIAVRMAAMLRNFVGNVVDDNNAIEQYQPCKGEQEQGEIIEKNDLFV
jgi:hypothetical protein